MFITIVTKCYYTCDLYYICDQLLHLCLQQAFPSPSPPCNVVLLLELPAEKNNDFEWRGGGGVWIVLFSEVTLLIVSAILPSLVGTVKIF